VPDRLVRGMPRRGKLILILGVCVVGLIFGVGIWVTRTRNQVGAPPTEVRQLLPIVVSYLERKEGRPSRRSGGWSLFCGVRYLGNSPLRLHAAVYVWEVCQEYRAQGTRLTRSTAWSVPAVISVVHTATGYRPTAEDQPVAWPEDVRRMFPSNVQAAIYEMDGSASVGAMLVALDRRARHELLPR